METAKARGVGERPWRKAAMSPLALVPLGRGALSQDGTLESGQAN